MIGDSLDLDQLLLQPVEARGYQDVSRAMRDSIRAPNLGASALEPPYQNGNTQEQPTAAGRFMR
jgi:hypothetical protein